MHSGKQIMKTNVCDDLKILLLDLELTYAVYYAYPSKREQYLSDRDIIHDQFCVCAAWKWLHEASTYAISITDDTKQFKKDFRNDRNVASKLHALMEEADIIVAHNGDNFDIKHATTLFRKHGLGPISKTKSLDTLKIARRYFAFPGNSLDSLAKRFGKAGKNKKPNWKKMTEGDKKEIDIATKYCKNDVKVLEDIFIELRPYIDKFPSLRRVKDFPVQCDACQSKRLIKNGTGFDGTKMFQKVKCQECGHNHRCSIGAK